MAEDDVYRAIRDKVAGYTGAYADYVMLVPDLFLLVTRLMLDPRIESNRRCTWASRWRTQSHLSTCCRSAGSAPRLPR